MRSGPLTVPHAVKDIRGGASSHALKHAPLTRINRISPVASAIDSLAIDPRAQFLPVRKSAHVGNRSSTYWAQVAMRDYVIIIIIIIILFAQ